MVNILIPTDFTIESTNLIRSAIRLSGSPVANIILFHAFSLPQSPFDLLASEEPTLPQGLLTEKFRQACKNIKKESDGKVGKIVLRIMRGDGSPLFRNFLDANEIDMIYFPADTPLRRCHPASVDPRPLFNHCKVPVIRTHPVELKMEAMNTSHSWKLQIN